MGELGNLEDSDLAAAPRASPSRLYSKSAGRARYLSSTYEVILDYDVIENELLIDEEEIKGYKYFIQKNVVKWVMFLLIGLITASIASTVDIAITSLTKKKYIQIVTYIEKYEHYNQHMVLLLWIFLNVTPFLIGLLLVTYIEPVSAGSGIPLVKCYLNGVEVPRVLAFKTLFVKATGLVCSIVGGVASGKEGPMIHIGACVANLLSHGSINICGKKVHTFRYFRDDTEMRDMVSAGAASGVSAAFGASVGGVLFSLEEGASFWNQNLTWRIFFASAISKFTVNLILSAFHGRPGDLNHPSLVNLGKCDFKYEIIELPIYMAMGALGGSLGALWNYINFNLSIFRISKLKQKWMRILEGVLVSAVTAVIAFIMTFYMKECGNLSHHKSEYLTTALCPNPNEFNIMASMWLQTPQASVNNLLHDAASTYSYLALSTFTIGYYVLSCITFGLSSSNGIFVPSLLTGAAWGRLLCMGFRHLLPQLSFLEPGKYALIAAAAQLGGVVRMTISLTVIIMETSNNITFSLPIIVTLICAKMTGDFFNDGIYDITIRLKAAPFLAWDPPVLTHGVLMTEIMHRPAITMRAVESADYIIRILENTTHNGFPVVDSESQDLIDTRHGKIKGLILRSQLLVLLVNKMFVETMPDWKHLANLNIFNDAYPNKYKLTDIILKGTELQNTVDLRIFMNNSPYTLLDTASLPRAFRLFRAIGLRHLPIVNDSNEVVGMITRKDLAKFKTIRQRGRLILRTLAIH